jgi:hypothetical protein
LSLLNRKGRAAGRLILASRSLLKVSSLPMEISSITSKPPFPLFI